MNFWGLRSWSINKNVACLIILGDNKLIREIIYEFERIEMERFKTNFDR